MSLLAREITYKSLLRFAAPTILSYLFLNIYFIIDGVLVARAVGTAGLAAVNLTMPVFAFIMALATVISTGGGALIASLLGKGKTELARQGFTFLVVCCMIGSAFLALLSVAFLSPLLAFFGADAALFPLCKAYVVPLLLSGPFIMCGMVLDSFLVVEGRPTLSLVSAMLGGLVNIVLDYLFLFGWGMGIEGAGIASGIGYSCSALVGLAYFGLWRGGTLALVKPVPRWAVLKKSVANGASEMVTMLSVGVVVIVTNNIMMELAGEDGVAAIAVAEYAEELLISVYLGYAEGVAPLMSYNYGARDHEKMRGIFRFSLRIIAVFAALSFAASLAIAEPLAAVFVEGNEAVLRLAAHGFRIFCARFLFIGFNIYMSSLFTALNDGRTSALLSFADGLVFLLGMLLLLPRFFGLDGIWLAKPASEILSLALAFWLFRENRRAHGL